MFREEDAMQPEPGSRTWNRECRAVVVGIQPASRSVERVYVRNDGRMASASRIHRPTSARQARKEAADAFGLACAREFPREGLLFADLYAAQLWRDLEASAAHRGS